MTWLSQVPSLCTPPLSGGVDELEIGPEWHAVWAPTLIGPWMTSTGCTEAAHIRIPDGDDTGLYWITPADVRYETPRVWASIDRYISVHTSGLTIPLPHGDVLAGPGPHWVRPSRWRGYVADPTTLLRDLGSATLALGKPAQTCAKCLSPVWPEDRVMVDLPGRPIESGTVHRDCATTHGLTVLPGADDDAADAEPERGPEPDTGSAPGLREVSES